VRRRSMYSVFRQPAPSLALTIFRCPTAAPPFEPQCVLLGRKANGRKRSIRSFGWISGYGSVGKVVRFLSASLRGIGSLPARWQVGINKRNDTKSGRAPASPLTRDQENAPPERPIRQITDCRVLRVDAPGNPMHTRFLDDPAQGPVFAGPAFSPKPDRPRWRRKEKSP
jgi:hypothetical protein